MFVFVNLSASVRILKVAEFAIFFTYSSYASSSSLLSPPPPPYPSLTPRSSFFLFFLMSWAYGCDWAKMFSVEMNFFCHHAPSKDDNYEKKNIFYFFLLCNNHQNYFLLHYSSPRMRKRTNRIEPLQVTNFKPFVRWFHGINLSGHPEILSTIGFKF
jgi:hypothetical protein